MPGNPLLDINNLSDVSDVATARESLDVDSKEEGQARVNELNVALNDEIGRTLRTPSDESTINTLPSIDERAYKNLAFTSDGSPFDVNSIIDVRLYGATPNDSNFDSLPAIQNAINDNAIIGLFGQHYYISGPIYVPSHRIIEGHGGKLSTLSPSTSGFMAGSIFAPGNYHPAYWEDVLKVSLSASEGSSIVTLADPSIVDIGDIIRLSSIDGILSAGYFVSTYCQLARVIGKSDDQIMIDSPVETSLTLVAANASQPNYPARFNKPLFCCSDSTIKDIEIDTWDYWTADSATFNTSFINITGRSKSVVYGNSFCKSFFRNITIEFNGRFSEMAFGSHDTTLENINGSADTSGTMAAEALSWTESGRRCSMTGFTLRLNSTANPTTVIRISGHQYSSIKNGSVYVYSNTNNILSFEHYGTGAICAGNTFENIDIFVVNACAVVCDVYKSSSTSVILNPEFRNIRYFGPTPGVALFRARGTAYVPPVVTNGITTVAETPANLVQDVLVKMRTNSGGLLVLNNSNSNNLIFDGDVSISSLVTIASANRLVIRNAKRYSAKSNNYRQDTVFSVTSLVAGTIKNQFIYQPASLRINDLIHLSLGGGTAGLTGAKMVRIGFLGADNAFNYIEMAAASCEQTYWTIKVEISFFDNSALLTGFITKGTTVSGAWTSATIVPLATGVFTIQVQAWKAAASDGLSFSRMSLTLEDLTQ